MRKLPELKKTLHIVKKNITKRNAIVALVISSLICSQFSIAKVQAATTLNTNTILPSNSTPSATGVTYTVGLTFPDAIGTISCIQVVFGTTSALSTPATGMTFASGGSISGGGVTTGNWSVNGSTNGTLQIDIGANTANTHTATATTITFTGVTNPSITNPTNVFAQTTVFPTSNSGHTCSGTASYQSPVMAILYTTGVTMSASVDPSLSLSVADDGATFLNGDSGGTNVTSTATTIPFATLVPGAAKYSTQTLTVGTNAKNGYSLYVNDTAQLKTAANDVFTDQSGTFGSPAVFSGTSSVSSIGVAGDGSVSFSGAKFAAIPQTATIIHTNGSPTASQATHVEYKIEASNTQAPGSYTTTIMYTAVPSY